MTNSGVSLIPRHPHRWSPYRLLELIVKTLNNSNRPVMVFVSGNHTNLAEALRLDPGIVDSRP